MRKSSLSSHVPALISGVALVFCFPYYKYGLLAFVALVPFLVSLFGRSPRGAFMAGFLMGLPYFYGTNYWVYHSISMYGGVNIIVSYLLVLLLSMYLSLYTGVFASLYVWQIRRGSLPSMLVAPVFWVMLEYLRSMALTGFPYSLIGYTQHAFLRFIQISDITGVYGVSFLVVAVNGAIADFFLTQKRVSEKPLFDLAPTINGYLLIIVIIVANLFYGSWRLNEYRPDGIPLRAAIVQPNIEQDVKWDSRYKDSVLNTLESMTVSAVNSGAEMVIWPETALPFYLGLPRDAGYMDSLSHFINSVSTPVLTGAVHVHKDSLESGALRLSNSSVLFGANGHKMSQYDKVHLVPFGEYVPLKGVLGFLDKLVNGIGDYMPGSYTGTKPFRDRRFATAICYEIAFPSLIRDSFRKEGDFLVTLTNDAWFGRTTGPFHHFSMSVFRAIENRKPVLRAANTGVSGFLDSTGRVLQNTPIFTRTVITETVTTDNYRSFYSRFGDLFIYFCSIITILLIADVRRR